MNEKEDVDQKLISILSSEIQRDGGSSLVRDLKDYANIDSLLKRCSHKNSKLLSFLESHSSIFEVDRNSLPHIVYLISTDHCSRDLLDRGKVTGKNYLQRINKSKGQLVERILCTIKKEKSKNERRNFGTADQFASSVSVSWLMKQCKSQLHHYLRMEGYYMQVYESCRDVHMVGSNSWYVLVTNEFIEVVQEMEDCDYDNGRILLQTAQNVDIDRIATTLIEKVEKDGGTHISLSLLLHRYPDMRKMLSGLDLIDLKRNNENAFRSIQIFTKGNEVCLQSKSIQKGGRMEVDETGLFSVASSKWGNAFASLMAKHCRSTLLEDPMKSTAIDLTASVGGVTLPLAKTFVNVIACEIDEHRAVLCKRNMANFGVHDQVEVINEDSVEYIPCMAKKCIGNTKVVIVDPP